MYNSMRCLWVVMAVFLLHHDISVAMMNERSRRHSRIMTAKEYEESAAEVAEFLREQQHHRSRRSASSPEVAAAQVAELRRLVEEHQSKQTDLAPGSRSMADEIAEIRSLINQYKDSESVKLAGSEKRSKVPPPDMQPWPVPKDAHIQTAAERSVKQTDVTLESDTPLKTENTGNTQAEQPIARSSKDGQDREGLLGNLIEKVKDEVAERNVGDLVCQDYEMPAGDGSHCVCAAEDTCGSDGGCVCDDLGNVYKSQCSFLHAMCSGEISTLRVLDTCHECEYIKLTGGFLIPEDPVYGLGIFKRAVIGESVEYEAIDGSDFRVWKLPELEHWVVGIRNESGAYINMKAYMAGGPSDPLSISKNGFYIIVQREDQTFAWDLDDQLHFECLEEKDVPTLQKRFFFTALIVVAVVVTVTAVTLDVVQAAKGCLYFDEVCDLRDEIEDHLKPRVESKQAAFKAKYGDASVYKDNSIVCYGKANELRRELLTVQELYKEMGRYMDSALAILNDIPNLAFDFDFGFAVEAHKDYKEGLGKQAQIGIVMLEIEIMVAAYTLATTTTVTTAALAFAAIGAAVAIFVAVASIIKSIEQERKMRDTLRDNKNKLLDAERQIDEATTGMINLQKGFCKELLVPLSKMSQAGAAYSLDFFWFMTALEWTGTFVTEPSVCNLNWKYGAITGAFLKDTLIGYLDYIIAHVKADIVNIRAKVEDAKKLDAFAQALRNDVLVNAKKPSAILTFVQQNKPEMLNSLFGNEFELLQYLAKNFLNDRACYWGISLEPFRSGAATASNYQVSSVVQPCSSPEVSTQTTLVANDVASGLRPCRIIKRVDSSFIRDVSGLMRYIASEAFPNQRCYWGYDLAAIRAGSLSDDELNNAEISYHDLRYLGYEEITAAAYQQVKDEWCSYQSICSATWVNFVLCVVNPAWSSIVGSCAGIPDQAGCQVDAANNLCS